ncbi:MAG: rhomboid family intramembrane serine protease [Ilyomonas sp.]
MTEFRPSRFEILPTIIKNLLIINVLVFLAQQTFGESPGFRMDNLFALHTFQSELFKPWQFVTHMFMHGSWMHLFGNMFALWMFGSILENLWGPKRFLTFYIICGLGAAFCHMIVLYIENANMISDYNSIVLPGDNGNAYEKAVAFMKEYGISSRLNVQETFYYRLNEATLGASGAVFGCLAAFGFLFPNTYIYLYFFLPIKAKWFVIGYAAFELFSAVQSSAGDNVAHVAHLGGALVGIILVYFWNKKNRRTFY